MPVTCTKLTETFAAEVEGIDIAVGVSDTDMADVVRLFNDFSVLVLHDQDINDEQQIHFSRKFSELGGFGGLEGTVLTNDGAGSAIALISNVDPQTDTIIPPRDRRMIFNSGNEMWHSDSSFKRIPSTASMLSGREVPPAAGETEFASMRAAYADLSEEKKRHIDALVAIHDFAYSRGLIDPTLIGEEQKRETPPVPHAVVRTNPVNGRKNFFAGAHASYVRDLPVEDGRILLKDLTAFAVQPPYVYTHKWRPKDLVIWDNRCCLHRGRTWDKARYRRVMHRSTVAGIGPTALPG
ncbi:MAG: TauD/TfdA family dioxygenase [bacterium]|nr:TauD/TfdA family dioxygenase [bacterium]